MDTLLAPLTDTRDAGRHAPSQRSTKPTTSSCSATGPERAQSPQGPATDVLRALPTYRWALDQEEQWSRHTDFTLLKAALDLTRLAGPQRAGLRTREPGLRTDVLAARDARRAPAGAQQPCSSARFPRPVSRGSRRTDDGHPVASHSSSTPADAPDLNLPRMLPPAPGRVGPGARTGLWAPLPHR